METLQFVMKLSILVFVVAGMAALGLSLKFKEIVKPLKLPSLVGITLLLNFIASPAIALFLTWLLPVHTPYETGLLLLSAAAGAPFLPKLVELAHSDVTLSVSILLLQLAGSIVMMPITLPVLIPGLEASALSIAMPLVLQMMLPLVLGLILQQLAPLLAARLYPVLKSVTSISALAAIILLLVTNMRGMLGTISTGAGLLALGFVLFVMSIGYLGGILIKSPGIVHALAGGQRNIAAALVIAASNHLEEDVIAMLMLATFVGLIPLIGGALYHKRVMKPRLDASGRL